MHILLILLLACQVLSCGILEKEISGICIHKHMWPPHTIEIFSYLLVFAICNLANATGIGGGGMLVPLLVLMMGFPAHNAIPLSKSIILGGAIVSVILSLRTKPVLIDFKIVSLLQPMILLGTTVGVVLNKAFPDWMILMLLTSTLIYVIYKNITKAFKLFREETKKIESANEQKEKNYEQSHGGIELMSKGSTHDESENFEVIPYETFPMSSIGLIVANYLSVLLFALIKGGSGMESILEIEQCSKPYWILAGIYACYCMTMTFFAYKMVAADLSWTLLKSMCYTCISFFGGIGSGMLGLGGGVIISPLLLDIGVPPEATAASSSLIVLFTSSSTSLQFFLGNMLDVEYAAVMFGISMLASLTGITFISRLIKKYQRPSIIVFILAGITILSAILLPGYSFYVMSENDTFHEIC
ncbi:hypothetical protein SteCoe_3953 [Stentor coeruleus]|uniref:Membrane transporter protein n=1 Tax=Stentor coeruleus TaxID=5963 RepID=A0A1R2CVX8_9CILI|nr:hypothetical protein SteCoe_3953 [Stentor coeruleus]